MSVACGVNILFFLMGNPFLKGEGGEPTGKLQKGLWIHGRRPELLPFVHKRRTSSESLVRPRPSGLYLSSCSSEVDGHEGNSERAEVAYGEY